MSSVQPGASSDKDPKDKRFPPNWWEMSLSDQVRIAEREAREREEWLGKWEQAAYRDPVSWTALLFRMALDWSRCWRRYLRSRFGFDVKRITFVDQSRSPKTDLEWARLGQASRDHRLQMALARGMIEGSRRAEERGEDPAPEALREFFEVYRLSPWLAAVNMEFTISPTLRHLSTIEFAGWAATKISTRFPRLRRELGGGSAHQVHQQLLEKLPEAVLEAWHDLDPNADPHLIRTHAADILSGGGTRRRKDRGRYAAQHPRIYNPTPISLMLLEVGLDWDVVEELHRQRGGGPLREAVAKMKPGKDCAGDDLRFAETESFAAREQALAGAAPDDFELAEAVCSFASHYGLSEREAQVAYMRSAGWKHREIARRLGIDPDTSKVYLHRAKRKMS